MRHRSRLTVVVALATIALLAGCGEAERRVELQLETLNASGVTGKVTLVELDEARTRVEIQVDPAGHDSMPAHVHPGSCADLVPQPMYALENVVEGRSTTEVRAAFDELMDGSKAVNLHRSNQEMDVYTACVDLP